MYRGTQLNKGYSCGHFVLKSFARGFPLNQNSYEVIVLLVWVILTKGYPFNTISMYILDLVQINFPNKMYIYVVWHSTITTIIMTNLYVRTCWFVHLPNYLHIQQNFCKNMGVKLNICQVFFYHLCIHVAFIISSLTRFL